MKTLYLHLGTHKTGTTTLQAHLNRNAAFLKRHDLLYPTLLRDISTINRDNHHHFAFLLTGHPFRRWPDDFASELTLRENDAVLTDAADKANRELDESGCRDLILSSEVICEGFCRDTTFTTVLSKFKQLFPDFSVKVILYLRAQQDWAESWYQWQMRGGNNAPVEVWYKNFNKSAWLDYMRMVTMITDVFGKGAITLRVFSKQALRKDLFSDFMACLGIEDPDYQKIRNVNEGLTLPALQFQQIANRYLHSKGLKGDIFAALFRDLKKQEMAADFLVQRRGSLFPWELKQAIYEQWQASNCELAETFMGGNPVNPFSAPEPYTCEQPPAGFTGHVRHCIDQWLLSSCADSLVLV